MRPVDPGSPGSGLMFALPRERVAPATEFPLGSCRETVSRAVGTVMFSVWLWLRVPSGRLKPSVMPPGVALLRPTLAMTSWSGNQSG